MKKIIIAILGFSTFINSKLFERFNYINEITLSILLGLIIINFVKTKKLKLTVDILGYIGIVVIYLLNFFLKGKSLKTTIQLIIIFILLNFLNNIKLDNKERKIMKYFFRSYILINYIFFISQNSGIELNQNILGMKATVIILYFLFIYKNKEKLWILSSLGLILLSHSRSSLLVVIFVIIVIQLLEFFNIKRYKVLFLSFIGIKWIFIYLYTYVFIKFRIFNELSIKYFNKNFFSGRNKLWETGLEKLQENFLGGIGVGFKTSELLNVELSMHNLDLRILLEVGLIGYLLFIFYFFLVIRRLEKLQMNSYKKNIAISIILGILLQQTFEISLTQNNLLIGFLQWFMIYICFMEKIKVKYRGKNERKNRSSINRIRNIN